MELWRVQSHHSDPNRKDRYRWIFFQHNQAPDRKNSTLTKLSLKRINPSNAIRSFPSLGVRLWYLYFIPCVHFNYWFVLISFAKNGRNLRCGFYFFKNEKKSIDFDLQWKEVILSTSLDSPGSQFDCLAPYCFNFFFVWFFGIIKLMVPIGINWFYAFSVVVTAYNIIYGSPSWICKGHQWVKRFMEDCC